jgi:hypothetical protein
MFTGIMPRISKKISCDMPGNKPGTTEYIAMQLVENKCVAKTNSLVARSFRRPGPRIIAYC